MKTNTKAYEAPGLQEFPVFVEAGLCVSGEEVIFMDETGMEDYGGVPTETIF